MIMEAIRAQLGTSVPFALHSGVQILSVADGNATAAIAQTPTSINHIGSQHAGALFTVGEAASGAAMAGSFADILLNIRPLAAEARIAYTRIARGTITAKAQLTQPAADLRAKLEAEGKVAFDVTVDLTDEEARSVATMTVAWHVRKA